VRADASSEAVPGSAAGAGQASATWDAIILGGGAAGLFCALTAARRGRRVVVVDHAERLGRKILASGGGRCNFTNRRVEPGNYLSSNPHFVRSALARFTSRDFLDLVEARGIGYEERGHGRLFCRGSAREILELLLDGCRGAGVAFALGSPVQAVERTGAEFLVTTGRSVCRAPRLVLATGGLSAPATGSTDLGHRLARQFGLALVPVRPGLVPLLLPEVASLSGIAVDARVALGPHVFQENVLFTHTGLSGPAILQVSSYWQPGQPILLDLLPGRNLADEVVAAGPVRTAALNHIAGLLPRRLVEHRIGHLPAAQRPVMQLSREDRAALAEAFHRWEVHPSGTGGYAKAEVTVGGIDTAGFSSKTLESRAVPGLFAVGEVLDVTGWLGGYNFQWAWASGHAAGEHL
jgi:predicted Rossmann fold flavoprotein